jgi:Golgi SNAP receptor complex protein 2
VARTHGPTSLGQISASLAAMHRTIEDYDLMAKRETIKARQEKGQMYVIRI